jgi:Ca2+/Na+ antiporter
MFGWGLWQTANVVGQTALLRGAEGMALSNLTGLVRLIAGLVLGLLMLFVLAERRDDRPRRTTSAGS